jgi:hypothetical protein
MPVATRRVISSSHGDLQPVSDACLANKGHDTCALQAYLCHRNVTHTVRYTEQSPNRFKDFWRE